MVVSPVWLPVVGFEAIYQVSCFGEVRSIERRVFQKSRSGNNYYRTMPGLFRKIYIDPDGYRLVSLKRGKKGITKKVATLVAAAFIGPRPNGLYVCHRDGSRTNDVPANLYYGTQLENMQDMIRHRDNPR